MGQGLSGMFKRLNENIRQGLYNQQGHLEQKDKADQGQAIENTDVEGCSKENIKENIKRYYYYY